MKYNIKYTEEDFLQFQLFTASYSKRIQKQRERSKFLLMGSFLVIGVIFKIEGIDLVFWCLFIFAIITFYFYPKYLNNNFYKHYQSYVKEHFGNRLKNSTLIEFHEDYIFSQNEFGESKIKLIAIEKISEVPNYIFILTKNAQTFILPKKEIPNYDELFSFLIKKSEQLEFDYSIYKDWKWE